MNTRQVQPNDTSGYIPKLSTCLHCLAMPGILMLRKDFGFLFFRPKRMLLPISILMLWGSIHSLTHDSWEGYIKPHLSQNFFFLLVPALYLFWLLVSVWKQLRKIAPHDHYSGKCLLLPKKFYTPRNEAIVKIIVEPAVVFGMGCIMSYLNHAFLTLAFYLSAIAIFFSESMNHWFLLRREKRGGDAHVDAEVSGTKLLPSFFQLNSRSTSRQPKIRRPRTKD
ncbi:MAG TPA: hypothetical protein VG347_10915 [Verrucomicrobiae bacterium]|nr:hypothetical protein [Verrucomicrobiae bacterium]